MQMLAKQLDLSTNECSNAVCVRGRSLDRVGAPRQQLAENPLQHRAIERFLAVVPDALGEPLSFVVLEALGVAVREEVILQSLDWAVRWRVGEVAGDVVAVLLRRDPRALLRDEALVGVVGVATWAALAVERLQ